MRDLLALPSRRSLLAALPLLGGATLCALQLRPRIEIELTLLLEIQIIGLFPLIVGPLRARPRTWVGHAVRLTWVASMVGVFLARSSFEAAGWIGVATMVGLMAATYGPALFDRDAGGAFGRMMARWVAGIVAVFASGGVSAAMFGAGDSTSKLAWWAAICLLLLAGFEACRPAGGEARAGSRPRGTGLFA